ncbi:MAG: CcoQ/FixQ family Cbb3-type cytochrome c oxidase assembly chaperone [Burkholderiaceae bacterium]|jgi:cytochrome c oxidase cbb3-type subunit 4|nr:CcoQ/FixQ family Cbb3-type cytochrome c oxidase assembly chaperone [Burkholderiaceae bacterium]
MDINVLRGVIAVVCLVLFLGIVWWAYSRHQRARFEEAANLPFVEKD